MSYHPNEHVCPYRGCTVVVPDSQYQCDRHTEIAGRARKIGSDRRRARRLEAEHLAREAKYPGAA